MRHAPATPRPSRFLLCATLSVLASSLGACESFDREAMLGGIVDTVILPGHRSLLAEAEALEEATGRFVASPDSASLEELRAQWLTTERAWKGVELFEFEGLLLVQNKVERRPPRIEFIERTIGELATGERAEADAEMVESLGSTTKGLAAIEYLIFPAPEHSEPILEAFEDPARAAFLEALAANLVDAATDLLDFWTPEGSDYATTFRNNATEGADIQGSISMLANNLIELYEVNMQTRLGTPMGRTTDGEPRPDEVEAPLSGSSLALMLASLESVHATFDAGLDDYLDYLDPVSDEDRLSARIHEQFAVVFQALEAIDPPLREAVVGDAEAVAAAYEEMRTLLVLLKTDMAARLGITVTFSDADGD